MARIKDYDSREQNDTFLFPKKRGRRQVIYKNVKKETERINKLLRGGVEECPI